MTSVTLPDAGDVAWVEFDPVMGTEQAGRRPALVISQRIYHAWTRRVLVAPITRSMRPWPFHVPIPPGLAVAGAIMVDQVRVVDRAARHFEVFASVPPETLAEVRGRLAALIGVAPSPMPPPEET